MRRKLMLTVLGATCLLGSQASNAQSWRCGNGLVSVGDTQEDVQRVCGEPVARSTACEAGPIVNGVSACSNVERWTYRPGYGQFTTILKFGEDGTLVAIVYGDRQ